MNDSEVPINSVKRSYEIVDTISKYERAGVTELSAALSLPKSTIHNHLQTLETLGYLVKTGGKYRLSNQYLRLGRESRNSNDFFLHGRKAVKELTDQANTYNQLVIEEKGRGTILLATGWQYEALPPSSQHVYPTHEYLHTNAPGKAILAALPEERVAEIIETHGLTERTNRTITAKGDLVDELSMIQERGYAIDRGEMISGIMGIGTSIATEDTVYGAIGAYGPVRKMQSAIEGDVPKLLREKAEEVREDIAFTIAE